MTHAEFWGLSLRELDEVVGSSNRRRRADYEARHQSRLIATALQTAELVNIVGTLGAGRDWKSVTAKRYYEAWAGESEPPEDAHDRIERAKQITNTRLEREKWSF